MSDNMLTMRRQTMRASAVSSMSSFAISRWPSSMSGTADIGVARKSINRHIITHERAAPIDQRQIVASATRNQNI